MKGVYPQEYMDDQEKFNEANLSEKEEICSNLNVEDIKVRVKCMRKEFVKTLK